MEHYQTDEQQLVQLKHWWQQYGRSLLSGISLALLGVLGFQFWQSNDSLAAEEASIQYQSVVSAYQAVQAALVESSMNASESVDVADSSDSLAAAETTLKTLVSEMQDQHPRSIYSALASFYAAKQAMNSGRLDDAVVNLQWVIDHAKDPAALATARQRLARVYWAQEQFAAAHDVLDAIKDPAFQVVAAELQGDLWVAQGELDKARQAYALARSDELNPASARPFVELKSNDLAR